MLKNSETLGRAEIVASQRQKEKGEEKTEGVIKQGWNEKAEITKEGKGKRRKQARIGVRAERTSWMTDGGRDEGKGETPRERKEEARRR